MTTMLLPTLRRATTLCVLAASLTTSLLQAQDQDLNQVPNAALRPTASPILPGQPTPDGRPTGLWANGGTYKVSFHDGMTFYPYVGAELPHQPMHWRTTSVRAGSTELLHGDGAPTPRYDGLRCEYELGGVTECYEVRDQGLEQTFVVAERPAAGDLVITGEITTPLVLPTMAARHGALSLRLPDGRAVIDYGAAIAIDSHGVRTAVTTATDGTHIVLRVAAETLAAASFPLCIDPLIGTSTQLATGDLIDDVDVLHETLTASGLQARAWVAYSLNAAAGDKDIYLYRFAPNFGGGGTLNYREITNSDSTHGRLALAPAASRIVLVHSLDFGNNRVVYVHSHHTLDNNLVTSAVIVPFNLSQSDWRPDVGGRLQPNGSKVLITFQREVASPFTNTANSTVYATIFDAAVNPQSAAFVVPPFVVMPRPNYDQERPVCNQFANGNNWLVAFQELNNSPSNDDWDITTVAIDGNGTVVPTGLDVAQASDPLLHAITPEIAGDSGRYLLTYTTRAFELTNPKPQGAAGSTVYAQRIDWDHGTNTGALAHPVVTLQTVANNALTNGSIGFDTISSSHWCVGFQSTVLNRYRVQKLGYTGNVVESALISMPPSTTPSAIGITFNSDLRTFPIVFAQNDGTATGNLVNGTIMEYDAVAAPTLVGFACGSGVWTGLDATAKRQQIGSEDMALRLTNAPQDTVALLIVSTAQGNLPADPLGAPGCVLVPDILSTAFLGIVSTNITGGDATLKLDLPEALTPMTLALQWAYLVPNVNPLWLQASEGLSVPIGR